MTSKYIFYMPGLMIGMAMMHAGEKTRLIIKKLSEPGYKPQFNEFEEVTLSEWIIKSILDYAHRDKAADSHNLILTAHNVVDRLLSPKDSL